MCFGGEYLHTVTASTTEQVHGSLWLWTGTRNGHQLCSYSPQFANVVLTSLLPLYVLLLQKQGYLDVNFSIRFCCPVFRSRHLDGSQMQIESVQR